MKESHPPRTPVSLTGSREERPVPELVSLASGPAVSVSCPRRLLGTPRLFESGRRAAELPHLRPHTQFLSPPDDRLPWMTDAVTTSFLGTTLSFPLMVVAFPSQTSPGPRCQGMSLRPSSRTHSEADTFSNRESFLYRLLEIRYLQD